MIAGARSLPVQHLSIRVPWHDAEWTGTVCKKPASNTACRALRRIADTKDDTAEAADAGKSFTDLEPGRLPPCVQERGGFMAPFAFTTTKEHPYAARNPNSYGHLLPTPYPMPPYSAACVPFRWMLKEESAELVERYRLDYQPDREPDLGFEPAFIQDRSNQLIMLDTFFGAIRPERSLCFFYAKDTPLSASMGRVIIGVGLVRSIHDPVEYRYSTLTPPHRYMIWERNVEHSIRPDFQEGFVFPYGKLFDLVLEKGLDPEQFLAFAPDDAFWSFSYASEHVSNDHAIASVLSCMRVLQRIESVLPGPWEQVKAWLDDQLNRLWRMRGPFPGFGSALTAFLGDGGNLVAYELAMECAEGSVDENVDPWPAFERIMQSPARAEGTAREIIGESFTRTWHAMAPDRKKLLKLLSRFSLDAAQVQRFFDPDERPDGVDDSALLANPYLLYELDRFSLDPISVMTIDRGMLPDRVVRDTHPLPERSRLDDKVDSRRVRALMVSALESGSEEGHTLLPRERITHSIKDMPLDTDCPAGLDTFNGIDEMLGGVIDAVEMADGSQGYQLRRLVDTAALIRRTVQKRVDPGSRRHEGEHDFWVIVNEHFGDLPEDPDDAETEEAARTEKAAALAEIFASRLSVLAGAAGTGKTTLLKLLCDLPEVEPGGVLLLAPTGKARVQLEQRIGRSDGFTIAQFLMRHGGRYHLETGRYVVTGKADDRCRDYRTVIVDECSMLTEEQLAALLDGLTGVHRLVLVGDHRQLPPIGSGRPFVDIVNELQPENADHIFPRVGRGYAELTVPRRQQGDTRADLLLAGWFGGGPDPAADEIWDRLQAENMDEIRFESWTDDEDLQEKLLQVIVEELELDGPDDEAGFECSLGAEPYNDRGTFFWRGRTDGKAEEWQIISPVRGADHGVEALNRVVQQKFRRTWLSRANTPNARNRRIHLPLGRQGIIYGDKVINLRNDSTRKVFPERESYVANGDVGIVVRNYKTKRMNKLFPFLEVEFTSQPGHDYDFGVWEFSDNGSPPLELAYALTVHKTQGSEFRTTFVVLPNPCWPLSRELLYTALTRQKERVVILHQGDLRELRRYANEAYSDIARRLTNLFAPPKPILIDADGTQRFLDDRLIHRTTRGDLVRSKSEVIIANELLAQGIDRYEYEAPLVLSNGETRYPDFTIVDDDTGECYYWEHLGLLHNPDYAKRWKRKLALYRKAKILPYEEGGGDAGTLIVTKDEPNGSVDSSIIAKLIAELLAP